VLRLSFLVVSLPPCAAQAHFAPYSAILRKRFINRKKLSNYTLIFFRTSFKMSAIYENTTSTFIPSPTSTQARQRCVTGTQFLRASSMIPCSDSGRVCQTDTRNVSSPEAARRFRFCVGYKKFLTYYCKGDDPARRSCGTGVSLTS
jgi:hypothetical protein